MRVSLLSSVTSGATLALIALTLLVPPRSLKAEEQPSPAPSKNLLENSELATWKDGKAVGWDVLIGATQKGRGKDSQIEHLPSGGVRLVGDGATVRWLYLRQLHPARVGTHWRLSFEGRALASKREPGQFGSCYAGLAFRNANGQVLRRTVRDVRRSDWTADILHVAAPPECTQVEVALFLSQTGSLELRKLRLEQMQTRDAFRVLEESMRREYPFFKRHDIPWDALVARHGPSLRQATSSEAFRKALQPFLAALGDPHVSIANEQGQWIDTVAPPRRTANAPQIARLVPGLTQVGNVALVGKLPSGDGYLLLASLQGPKLVFDMVHQHLLELRDTCPGLVIDLRLNGGGDERIAQRLAALLADRTRDYGHAQVRSGPAFDEFVRMGTRQIGPGEAGPFAKPVAVLLGPACMSSGEALAMMLATLPHARSFGEPTRGASGSPRALELPGGVVVRYSTWISLLPDGSVFERTGLQPDERVVWAGALGPDPVLERAEAWLREQHQQPAPGK